MANNNTMDFKRYMSPDFQASTQPQMNWMPWDDPAQQGADMGSILGQLKPQAKAGGGAGGMYNAGEGFGDQMVPKAGGGKGSL